MIFVRLVFVKKQISAEEVDEDDGKHHEDGDDKEENLAPLLSLALEDNGIETALLEERGTVLVMMVVMGGHSEKLRVKS